MIATSRSTLMGLDIFICLALLLFTGVFAHLKNLCASDTLLAYNLCAFAAD